MQLRKKLKIIFRNGEKRDSCESLQSMIAVTSCCHHDGASVRSAPGSSRGQPPSAMCSPSASMSPSASATLPTEARQVGGDSRFSVIVKHLRWLGDSHIDIAGYSKRWIKDDIWYFHYSLSITDCLKEKVKHMSLWSWYYPWHDQITFPGASLCHF